MPAIVQFYLSAIVLMLPLLFCVGIGVYWGKRDLPFGGSFITTLVTSVTTPALVFHTFVTTRLDDRALADVAAATVLALLLCALAGALLLKVLKLPVRTLLPTAFLPNAGNLGLPMSQLAFGDAGLSVAVAFFAVNSFIMHTVAVRLLPGVNTRGSWKSPILLASLAAVGMRVAHVPVPDWLIETARMLGAVTVPLMLLSLGHALALIPSGGVRDGVKVAAIRLITGLAAGLLVVWALDLEAVLAGALTLQMAMPCAVVSYVRAPLYGPGRHRRRRGAGVDGGVPAAGAVDAVVQSRALTGEASEIQRDSVCPLSALTDTLAHACDHAAKFRPCVLSRRRRDLRALPGCCCWRTIQTGSCRPWMTWSELAAIRCAKAPLA